MIEKYSIYLSVRSACLYAVPGVHINFHAGIVTMVSSESVAQQHDRAGQAATAPVGMNPPARLPVIANLLSTTYQGYRQIDNLDFF